MFRAAIDRNRNLLLVSYSRQVNLAEAQQCAATVAQLLPQLQPGFSVLTDLSGLEAMEFACAPVIEKMMDRCRKQGVGQVIRVIPDPKKDIGFRVMSYFHYGHHVPIVTCETLAEAMQRMS